MRTTALIRATLTLGSVNHIDEPMLHSCFAVSGRRR